MTTRKQQQLYNDNPRGRPRLRTLGYGTRKKAVSSVKQLRKMNKAYQRQTATTMYYRAKHHKYRTKNMEAAMKVYKKFLDSIAKMNGGARTVKVKTKDTTYEGTLFGIEQASGKYIVQMKGTNTGRLVDKNDVEFLTNAPSLSDVPCAFCGLSSVKYTEEEFTVLQKDRLETVLAGIKQINPIYVDQDSYIITDVTVPSFTYGLATCTALSVRIGKYKFLTHLSAASSIDEMAEDIRAVAYEQKIELSTLADVTIWTGTGASKDDPILLNDPSAQSLTLAKKLLAVLEIPLANATIYNVCFIEIVGL